MTHIPDWPSGQGAPPSWPPRLDEPAPPRRRSGVGCALVVGLVVVALLSGLVWAGVRYLPRLGRDTTGSSAGPGVSGAPSPRPLSTVLPSTVPGGPTTSFHLPVGTAAHFADADGEWSVAVLAGQRFDAACDATFEGTFGDDSGVDGDYSVLVLDIRYEVLAGAVSVNPLWDFTFAAAGSISGPSRTSIFTGCDDPPLMLGILAAGDLHIGRIAFVVPGEAGGELRYAQVAAPTASWDISAG